MTGTAPTAGDPFSPVPEVSVVVPSRDRPGPLAACLVALEGQGARSFEVVVVDDRSRDGDAVAATVAGAPHARLVRGEGRGPAAARNLGARSAKGALVCFTDDDCRAGPGWIDALRRRVGAGAQAVAGPTRNARPADPFAAASQAATNHLVTASGDRAGHVGFAPTSNVAARSDVLAALPFDEGFPLAAGEDRDWCARLATSGILVAWEPRAWVDHHQDLDLRRFWRQQERYGRGAHRIHRARAAGERLQRPSFYVGLLRQGLTAGPAAGGLVVLGQVATASGVAREAWARRRH